MASVLNVSAYLFTRIDDPHALRETLRERAQDAGLKGTVILAEEGINLFLASQRFKQPVLAVFRATLPFLALLLVWLLLLTYLPALSLWRHGA